MLPNEFGNPSNVKRSLTSPAYKGVGKRYRDRLPHCPRISFQHDAIYTPGEIPTRENESRGYAPPTQGFTLSGGMDVIGLQEKISRIDGVEAARVVAGNGHIDEIHVLARRTKPPKQVVRDVQSLGQALFGINIDRRIVSVVQLADSVIDSGSRPALVDVAETIDGNRTEVTVTMKWRERLLVGQSTGAAASATRWRLVAEATLEAVRQSVHPGVGLGISSMDLPILGSRKLAVAQVVMVTDASERMLIGSAYVEDDESRAVVRAVLDALNRLLPDLKTP